MTILLEQGCYSNLWGRGSTELRASSCNPYALCVEVCLRSSPRGCGSFDLCGYKGNFQSLHRNVTLEKRRKMLMPWHRLFLLPLNLLLPAEGGQHETVLEKRCFQGSRFWKVSPTWFFFYILRFIIELHYFHLFSPKPPIIHPLLLFQICGLFLH